ncbi:MAG: GNAT family N-acetyltransferase [Myxococcales bacterium]|nr:GNAT family N-acetyltransferase [Myxococcales bacterium]
MRSEIIRDALGLAGLLPGWGALWAASRARPVTLHPAWTDAWWHTLGGEGELLIVACSDEEGLCGVAPFYLTPPRGGALRARELRLIGDGVVGARSAVLIRPGSEAAVQDAVTATLARERGWDLLDLALRDGAELEELASRFAAQGSRIEPAEARGRPEIRLDEVGRDWLAARSGPEPAPGTLLREHAGDDFARALPSLLEVARSATSPGPSGEPAFLRLLETVAPRLHAASAARLFTADSAGELIAGSLVLVDGRRWIELCSGSRPGVRTEIVTREAIRRAIAEQAEVFEFLGGEQPLANTRAEGTRMRVYGRTAAGMLQRGYASLARRAGSVADAATRPIDRVGDRIGRLRESAPEAVQRVVARVATFARLHLYRGELFVRGGAAPAGITLRLFSESDFDGLSDRPAFLARLGLVEGYCRQKWQRGDSVVLAELDGQPAGILWCARVPVHVPDIGREVRPLTGECYIHDVFVPPDARGRAVAPAMLDFLARELRGRDIYRAWALIERSNAASTRAFEKAAYASVADVIYARMGGASKLLVRPPDPEARAFLGVTGKPGRAR